MNKQMTSWFDTWCKYVKEGHTQSLYDFYEKPSSRKVGIYERICREHGGTVRILSANTFYFTVGYMQQRLIDAKYVYEFVVETAYNTYTDEVGLDELNAKGLDVSLYYKELVIVPFHMG